jgi:hypothetical protein
MPSPNINETITGLMTYTNRDTVTGATSSGNLGTYTIFHRDRTVVSVRTPNFRKLKPWQYPKNNYSYHWDTTSDPRWTFSTTSKPAGGHLTTWQYSANCAAFGCVMGHTAATTADDPTQKAINKIIEQISLTKTNSAIALAEMNKTVAHLAHTASRIHKAITALRKGRFGDFTNALNLTVSESQRRNFYSGARKAFRKDWLLDSTPGGGLGAKSRGTFSTFTYRRKFTTYESRLRSNVSGFLSDTWLEYSYGWKPLLKDVYDHAAASAVIMTSHQKVVRTAKARAFCERQTRTVTIPALNQVKYTWIGLSKIWVEIGVEYSIPDGAINISTAFGLQNPLEVAWELIPFSFVADWFLPVGDAIRALSAFNGLVFHAGYKTFKHERTMLSKVEGYGGFTSGGTVWSGATGGGTATRYEYEQGRTVLTSFPTFGWPQLNDPRSWGHAASAISLLESLFLRDPAPSRGLRI